MRMRARASSVESCPYLLPKAVGRRLWSADAQPISHKLEPAKRRSKGRILPFRGVVRNAKTRIALRCFIAARRLLGVIFDHERRGNSAQKSEPRCGSDAPNSR